MKYFFLVTLLSLTSTLSNAQSLDYRYSLLSQLAEQADQRGLPKSLYLNQKTINALNNAAANPTEYTNLINQYSEKIVSDIYRGRILPNGVPGKRIRISPKVFNQQALVQSYLNQQIDVTQLVSQIEPQNVIYRNQLQLLNYLKYLRDSKHADIPQNVTFTSISIGSTNEILVKHLRTRLTILGYPVTAGSPVFDTELDTAVRTFQADHKLGVDGAVGPNTWSFVNRDINQMIRIAQINLDRSRWLPDTLEAERISVNLADQSLTYFQNGVLTLSFKNINGRTDRQTPIMIDVIKNVVLNPTWTVPVSIFVKDKLPLLRQDPGYAAKHQMRIIDDMTGKEVDGYSVDWNTINASNLHYTLIQSPGPHNALGFLKFPMQNPWAIYLHDTNDRHLFANTGRLLSSGCVRLQQPFELAEKILGSPRWSVDSLKLATELNPVPATESTWLKTKKPVPVYLLYTTLFQKEDGRIITLMDAYGIDQVMAQAASM